MLLGPSLVVKAKTVQLSSNLIHLTEQWRPLPQLMVRLGKQLFSSYPGEDSLKGWLLTTSMH